MLARVRSDRPTELILWSSGTGQRALCGYLPQLDESKSRVQLCVSDTVIHALVQPRFHDGFGALVRFDLARRIALAPIDFSPMYHLGVRSLKITPWLDGSVLMMTESEREMDLCVIEPGHTCAKALSPSGCEVLDFWADPKFGIIAYLGVNINDQAPIRHLYIAQVDASGLQELQCVADVAATVALTQGKVVYLRGTRMGITLVQNDAQQETVLRRFETQGVQSRVPVRRGSSMLHGAHGLTVSGVGERPLLLFLPGIHKLPTQGIQGNLLQEFVYRIVAHSDHFDRCVVALPGSAGFGRQYREQVCPSDLSPAREAIQKLIRCLRERGFQRIGLISVSLGALSLLDALQELDKDLASAVICPVYTMSFLPGNTPHKIVMMSLDAIESDVLVIHGTNDEVIPYCHSEQFVGRGRAGQRILMELEGEGHIFQKWSSWARAYWAIESFFERCLMGI